MKITSFRVYVRLGSSGPFNSNSLICSIIIFISVFFFFLSKVFRRVKTGEVEIDC